MRVAITVAAADSDRVTGLARRAGLDPVVTPCIEIEPCRAPGEISADDADWILVTSTRTVELLWPDVVPAVPFIAVGARTADAVRRRKGSVAVEAAGSVAALTPHLDTVVMPSAKVLFPRASGADPSTAARLRRRGVSVDDPVVYRVHPVAPPTDPVTAVAFGSPSAVEGWLSGRSLANVLVGAIGPTTAKAVERAGGTVHAQPPRPTFLELFHAIGACS